MTSPVLIEPAVVNPQTTEDLRTLFVGKGVGSKVAMPHGGALLNGNPGNSGRPSKEAKGKWLELASGKAYSYAVECLNDPEKSPQERIAAMNAAVRQLGTTVTLEQADFPEVLANVLASHADQVPLSLAKQIVAELKEACGLA